MDVHERFEASRPRLRAVAYRMLGSFADAEDAVQEAWLRLDRVDAAGITNLDAWLTTVIGRVCLDILRTRTARREEVLDREPPVGDPDPEQEALLADAVGVALLVVLDTLTPAERLAFVLHDMFGVSFDEIGPIVDRNPAAARQLASRARRRVRFSAPSAGPGAGSSTTPEAGADRRVVDAFLAAARRGDFTTLLSLLDPDVRMRADEAAVRMGGPAEVHGSAVVAQFFSGRAQAARVALVDGRPGLLVAPAGRPRIVVTVSIVAGRITAFDAIADPAVLAELEIDPLPA